MINLHEWDATLILVSPAPRPERIANRNADRSSSAQYRQANKHRTLAHETIKLFAPQWPVAPFQTVLYEPDTATHETIK